MKQSIPIGDIEFISVEEINPGISQVQIKVCYVQDTPNRNGTIITKDFAQNILSTSLRGAPIVGHYNEETGDFEAHNKYLDITEDGEIVFKADTMVFGFVDLNAKIWFQNFYDEDKETREYLCTEGYIFTSLYPEAERILTKGNNQSMELEDVSGIWTKDINKNNKFFIISDAIIKNLCLLGEDYEPCFEGAQVKQEFSLGMEDVNNKLFSLMQEFTLNKGGQQMEYNLEDIVEYQELKAEYEAKVKEFEEKEAAYQALVDQCEELKTQFEALTSESDSLKEEFEKLSAEAADLREFKANVIKEQKQAKLDEFSMLSDEDKAEVIEHFDEYSLDEIEAKLAVICFKKKINFTVQEELKDSKQDVPDVYQLQEKAVGDSLGDAFKNLKEEQ